MPRRSLTLAEVSQELASEFHETKNGDLTATTIPSGSTTICWWFGTCGHEWQQRVDLRVRRGFGCVFCSGKQVLQGFNDLKSTFPELAEQWDYKVNSQLPEAITHGSGKKVWWLCDKGHSYEAAVSERVRQFKKGRNSTCPFCLNRKLVAGQNDLASLWPNLLGEWDFERNQADPTQTSQSLKSRVWWICPSGHNYDLSPFHRTSGRQNCPICSGKRVVEGVNDLETTHPLIALSFDAGSNNAGLTPKSLTSKSNKKIWWKCSLGHSFFSSVAKRTEGRGCPYCAGKSLLEGFNDLETRRPDQAKYWSPNNQLSARNVLAGSGKSVEWMCDKGHVWMAAPIWAKGCPFCANMKVWVGFNDLATTRPDLLEEWDSGKNLPLRPTQITAGSGTKVWWKCSESHGWRASPNGRARTGCPSCAPGGYDQNKPGIYYFLRNPELAARKVGITNKDSDRLERFSRNGWKQVQLWHFQDGRIPLEVETRILRWLRGERKLPPFLSKEQMRGTGGWSETLSDEEPTDNEIFAMVDEAVASTLEARKDSG